MRGPAPSRSCFEILRPSQLEDYEAVLRPPASQEAGSKYVHPFDIGSYQCWCFGAFFAVRSHYVDPASLELLRFPFSCATTPGSCISLCKQFMLPSTPIFISILRFGVADIFPQGTLALLFVAQRTLSRTGLASSCFILEIAWPQEFDSTVAGRIYILVGVASAGLGIC